MQAERMWQVSTGEGVTVAVVDSGVDDSVPELRGQVLPGRDFSGEGRGADFDSEGHGTSMAMIIAGKRSGDGTWGLAPGSKILPIRSLGGNWIVNMAKSIRYAADQGARVINISRGGPASDLAKEVLQPAIDYANQKGSLIFVATGNDGAKGNAPDYPSRLPGIVGVGAVDKSLKVTKFSVFGPQVALAAPGVEVPTRCTKALLDCTTWGTSDATAIASASAALVWSAHPHWTNNQVLRVMMETAGKPKDGKVPSKYLGYGIVRPRKILLDKEGEPGPADVNPLLAAHATATPSKSPQPEESSGNASEMQRQVAQADNDDSKNWPVIVGGGVVAGFLVIGGFLIVRRRRM
ncbi:type VII secretion-associated serine protease mycosin [Streptomyces sp. Je 1-4]|uniref:type VII secretion-associated serine protease mycosin n=1 Tax=Streptomyces TaxID=1883 RepID=UPI0021D8BBBD|nr:MULTISPECIES: type VII secretion-associated serine protease mycosin [unclassified Streptomyces]UYB40161.1 type VII secretion-associated serine protease mycosin [Streptomyces sp. Je 1-4]UZQ36252.1 type VII secretion-associated serine protease mycosin [Streptomyces sp. Je 1-4] [Streptomyces sp. Je 1-4 4N24]UZQ43670.1 type VII secretion-associated serine protease mycosin [Streptomyces sp. Je 1-4] [Streptomyces sp. Je 1-4 4N24_ara]